MFKKKDPVCGVKISKTTPYKLEIAGNIYHFDSACCRNTFINEPHRFIKNADKGFLKELAEKNKNAPKSCCYIKH